MFKNVVLSMARADGSILSSGAAGTANDVSHAPMTVDTPIYVASLITDAQITWHG